VTSWSFRTGDPHHLSAGSGTGQVESAAIFRKITARDLSPLQAGGGGATTRFVCGYLTFDPLLCGPILESLPPMLTVNVRPIAQASGSNNRFCIWSRRPRRTAPAATPCSPSLSEALFVDTLRR
jgi:hypothetical protein